MTRQDIYSMWILAAISEPNESVFHHFYDCNDNTLFSLRLSSSGFEPKYLNPNWVEDHVRSALQQKVKKVESGHSDIIELPRLSIESRRDFLTMFASQLNDSELHENLIEEIMHLKSTDRFDFKTDFKTINKVLHLSYDLDKNTFLAKKAREAFEPLGISESSEVLC